MIEKMAADGSFGRVATYVFDILNIIIVVSKGSLTCRTLLSSVEVPFLKCQVRSLPVVVQGVLLTS